jgi:predicted phage-related endonuclease
MTKNEITPSPENIAELDRRIEVLPQAQMISPEKRREWIEAVLRASGDDIKKAVWHLQRLRGFGGSEVGTLAMSKRGEFPPFDTARDVVAGKLCMKMPVETDDTARGHNAEPIIQKLFLEKFGAMPDDRALRFFQKKMLGLLPDHPWRVGNPDDIVTFDGKRYIVDYKCPRSLDDFKPDDMDAPFPYICQLHHYRGIAENIGIPIDGLAVVAWNAARFEPVLFPVRFDQLLEAELIETGEHYWNNFVLTGKLPPSTDRPRLIAPFDPTGEMTEAAQKLTIGKLIKQFGEGVEEDAKALLSNLIHAQGQRLGDAKLQLIPTDVKGSGALVNISAKLKVDEPGLIAELKAFGIDDETVRDASEPDGEVAIALLNQLKEKARQANMAVNEEQTARQILNEVLGMEMPIKPGKINAAAAVAALVDAGADPDPFLLEQFYVRHPQGKKGSAVEMYANIKDLINIRLELATSAIKGALEGQENISAEELTSALREISFIAAAHLDNPNEAIKQISHIAQSLPIHPEDIPVDVPLPFGP